MRLTTSRYYTPSGRSIQALGVAPDIIVNQPPRPEADPNAPPEESVAAPNGRTEASLRGALSNDAVTEDEKKQLEADQARAEETAKLREEDYQLAYAVDIIKGLSVMAISDQK